MSKKHANEVDKITFRLWPPYSKRVVEQAKAARIKPNELARIATMAMVDAGLLDLSGKVKQITDILIHFRRDFNNAVEKDTD